MELRKQATRAAAVSMTVGTLAMAGLGFAGTAHAQGNQPNDPQHTRRHDPDPGQGQGQNQSQDHSNWNNGNNNENNQSWRNGDHDSDHNDNGDHRPTVVADRPHFFVPWNQLQSVTEFVQPQYIVQPSYWPFANYSYYTDSLSLQSEMSLISDTAAVLNIPSQTVVVDLSQGWTLSQIAAQYGWPHDYFLSLLVSRIQSDVATGVANGSINPVFASQLTTDLINQATMNVDSAGLPVVLANIPFATLMQIFA